MFDLDVWHQIATSVMQAMLYVMNWKENMFNAKLKPERVEPFFVHDVQSHQIELRLSQTISTTVTTDGNGRFKEKLTVNSLDELNVKGDTLRYLAFDQDLKEQGDEGFVYLMRNQHGCSIISDIDDTIKISDVPDKRKLTVNTFSKDFQAVPGTLPHSPIQVSLKSLGMSELYRTWRVSHRCLVHYVSAMPSQLYYITQKFLNEEKFPYGSFRMEIFHRTIDDYFV